VDAETETAPTPRKRTPAKTRAATAEKAEKADKPAARSTSTRRRKDESKPTRRRTPIRRIAFPDVKKEILVSVQTTEQQVAVLEDAKVVEVYLDRPGHRSIAGNVYKGVVDNVLPGMEASFVDIGLEKNGFLYVDEIVVPELEGKRHNKRIQDLIKRGEEVVVQAVKDPMGTKGARLTTEVSLPGRFLVFVPYGDGIGVSRRLEDAERDRLKAIVKGLELPEGGIIVRTAAEGATQEELEGDLRLLQKLWSTIQGRASRTKAPALVYQEAELPLRIVRDMFIRGVERVVVDHERTYRRIVGYLRRTSPELAARVERYRSAEPLMEQYGVEEAVRSTLNRRVDLPSGGYLIFDYAEAFTVVDVNTGRFVGARGKSANGARLEDTITKNNLEAVGEVVRQLRLRDIGGIIVIDFIDMANPKNRESVEEALRRELERDRTKTYVVEISPLGLVEMTRQNVTDGPREILTVHCDVCGGDGILVSEETHVVDAERKLRRLVAGSKAGSFKIEVATKVGKLLGGPLLAEIERDTGRRFDIVTKRGAKLDHFALLEEGPPLDDSELERVEAEAVRAADGAVELGDEVELTDEEAADAEAATLTEIVTPAARATVTEVAPAAEPTEEEGEAAAAAAPAKPKTRRGSRGGRGRKKKPDAEAASGDEAAPAPDEEEAEAVEEPVAEGEESSEDGEVPKPRKRTRRGTRGGRGRKRKTAADTNGASAEEDVPTDEAAAAEADVVEQPEPLVSVPVDEETT
jgi:ribonuclease G